MQNVKALARLWLDADPVVPVNVTPGSAAYPNRLVTSGREILTVGADWLPTRRDYSLIHGEAVRRGRPGRGSRWLHTMGTGEWATS